MPRKAQLPPVCLSRKTACDAGGQAMDKLYSFNFESRTWSMRHCKRLLPSWTFGHAVRRKRSIFAYGSVQGDFGTLEVQFSLTLQTEGYSRCNSLSPQQDLSHAWLLQMRHPCMWQHADTFGYLHILSRIMSQLLKCSFMQGCLC